MVLLILHFYQIGSYSLLHFCWPISNFLIYGNYYPIWKFRPAIKDSVISSMIVSNLSKCRECSIYSKINSPEATRLMKQLNLMKIRVLTPRQTRLFLNQIEALRRMLLNRNWKETLKKLNSKTAYKSLRKPNRKAPSDLTYVKTQKQS